MDTEDLKRQLSEVVDRWFSSQRPAPTEAHALPAEHLPVANNQVTMSPPAGLAPPAPLPPARTLPTDKRAVRTKSSGDRVFMLDETKKTRQWVSKPEVLEAQGFSMNDVVEIEDTELLGYTQDAPLV